MAVQVELDVAAVQARQVEQIEQPKMNWKVLGLIGLVARFLWAAPRVAMVLWIAAAAIFIAQAYAIVDPAFVLRGLVEGADGIFTGG